MTAFRPGTSSDVPALVALMARVFDPRFGEAWSEAQLDSGLTFADTWLEVAPGAASPAGFTLTRRVGPEAELLLIAVDKNRQHRGLGRALLEQVFRSAASRGVTSLFLEVRSNNEAARRLYLAEGFRAVGRRPGYYANGNDTRLDAITMRRELNN